MDLCFHVYDRHISFYIRGASMKTEHWMKITTPPITPPAGVPIYRSTMSPFIMLNGGELLPSAGHMCSSRFVKKGYILFFSDSGNFTIYFFIFLPSFGFSFCLTENTKILIFENCCIQHFTLRLTSALIQKQDWCIFTKHESKALHGKNSRHQTISPCFVLFCFLKKPISQFFGPQINVSFIN